MVSGTPLSQVAGSTAESLLDQTIGQRLRYTTNRHGAAEAVVAREQHRRATYGEFLADAELLARGLMAIGVEPGDRVGLLAANRYEWLVLQYATALAGAILVPVNPLSTEAEVRHILRNAGVRVLLHRTAAAVLVGAARGDCPDLRRTVDIDADWSHLVQAASRVTAAELAVREAAVRPDDPAAILYTSGTTGGPKGVTLSHHSVLNNAYAVGQWLGYTAADRVCVPVPLFHCFGMVLGSLACTSHGACVVIPGQAYQALSVLETIHHERCTAVYGVPTMYLRELAHPQFAAFDLSSLRTGIMGGAACPADLVSRVMTDMGITGLTIAYGMTETAPISIQTRPGDPFEVHATTVGHVLPHIEVRIVDPFDGTVVPAGREGEICVRGYSVMLGYWNDPTATDAAIDAEGWMHTGDLGVMDEDLRFRYTGRIKDMIIVGGENISAVELENVLCSHPAVDEAQVIGVPDAEYGEQVVAWIRVRQGATAEAAELAAHCRQHLSGIKVPAYWKFVDEFPVTANGKIRKSAMRETTLNELRR
jgi:fatty-acyl-CoA synthase